MRNDKFISSAFVINQTISGFGLNAHGLKYDMIEWIGQGMQSVGYLVGYEEKVEEIEVKEHRGGFPCEYIKLMYLVKDGRRLRFGDKKIIKSESFPIQENLAFIQLLQKIDVKQQLYESTITEKAELIATVNKDIIDLTKMLDWKRVMEDPDEWYSINPYGFKFSFDSGKVLVFYKSFLVDDEGYPMLPDTFKYVECIRWWLLKCLMERGYKHSVLSYQDAVSNYIKYRAQAENEGKNFTEDELINLKEMWTSPLFSVQQSGTHYNN